MQSSSIFLPPTMAGRVCRIILLVLALVLGALLAVQATGTVPNSSMLIPGVFLLAMLDLLALSIIAVRKRARTPRSARIITIVLAAISLLLATFMYAQVSTYAMFFQAEYAKVGNEHGEFVVLRTFFALPEGTTAQQALENDIPEDVNEEDLQVYAAYEAYPVKWKFFHDRTAHVEGLAMAPFDMETGETEALLVDWEEDRARFYIRDADPAVAGEIFVYYDDAPADAPAQATEAPATDGTVEE